MICECPAIYTFSMNKNISLIVGEKFFEKVGIIWLEIFVTSKIIMTLLEVLITKGNLESIVIIMPHPSTDPIIEVFSISLY